MRTLVKTAGILIMFCSIMATQSTFAVIPDNGNPDTMMQDSGRNEGASSDQMRKVREQIERSIMSRQAETVMEIYKLFSSSSVKNQNNETPSTLTPTTTSPTQSTPTPDNPTLQFPPNQSFTALTDLYTSIGTRLRVPPCVLVAVSKIESPSTWNLSPGQILQYSSPGQAMPQCPLGVCSEKGNMQMTTGIDEVGTNRCANCCWKDNAGIRKCRDSCPSSAWDSFKDAIREYETVTWIPNPCNLRDETYAAAKKIRVNSLENSNSITWSRETINTAVRRYHGNCDLRYSRLNNLTYCEYVNYICSLK